MHWTRIIRWTALPLVLGAGTTVAVTWGLAAWLPQRNWPQTMIGSNEFRADYTLVLSEYRTIGAVRREWIVEYFTKYSSYSYLAPIDNITGEFLSDYSGAPLRGPRWGRAEAVRAHPLAFGRDGLEHATGWPMLAGWYSATVSYPPTGQAFGAAGGIYLKPAPGGRARYAHTLRALPLRPIWPGLLVNTAFYAALWLVALGAARMARRTWRRHRGRCTVCAYDLAGLIGQTRTCPECGTHAE